MNVVIDLVPVLKSGVLCAVVRLTSDDDHDGDDGVVWSYDANHGRPTNKEFEMY